MSVGDLYLSGEFNASNEYKWALIFYSLQLERDFVTFSSVQKDRFAKILLHFMLQLQQLRTDETIFFQNYIQDEKIISLFETSYHDVYEEIRSHISDKTYGVTGYLKDCLNGLKKIGLVMENPAVESLIALNTDLIQMKNGEISSKVNISDDIDELLNMSVDFSSRIKPSISPHRVDSDFIYEN